MKRKRSNSLTSPSRVTSPSAGQRSPRTLRATTRTNGSDDDEEETPRTSRRISGVTLPRSRSPARPSKNDNDKPFNKNVPPHSAPAAVSSEIRRSGRQRKLNYASLDQDFLVQHDDDRSRDDDDFGTNQEDAKKSRAINIRHGSDGRTEEIRDSFSAKYRSESKDGSDDSTRGRRRRRTSRAESPFFNHVRFSPSAKPGSPAAAFKRRSVRRVQLHNLPSEDEQSEFNRRYSRDLLSRRQRQRGRRYDNTEDMNEEGEMEEDDLPVRRSSRMASMTASHSLKMAEEEFEDEEEAEEDEEKIDEFPKRRPPGRKNFQKKLDEREVHSDPETTTGAVRRSQRTHKPIAKPSPSTSDDEEDDDDIEDDVPKERRFSLRPKRMRAPVERLSYAPPPRSSRRNGQGEIRNLDQYSTDDEFGNDGVDVRRRKKRYNMRENRRRITRFEEEYPNQQVVRSNFREREPVQKKIKRKKTGYSYKDSSSSSSSENTDEERFHKRKTKRMAIERSKLMPVNMLKQDVTKAIFRDRQKIGTSLADVSPMEMDLNVKFESVGGCDEHIKSLKEMVVFPLLYPEVFNKFSITPPRGVLFYGPPGTGKTLMARALASECSREGKKVAFFMRKGADCLSKWIGESERQLRLLFDQAYLMRPSIIFFDEIDGLAPVRSSRQDQIHSSIVSTLLALMDGLDCRGEIIVIGATNRIENIDPALRRPGRFDRELRFGLPTMSARQEILTLNTKSWEPKIDPALVEKLAEKTIGYCGADIKGLCAEAALNALRRRYPQVYKTNQKLGIQVDKIVITGDDFFKAMKTLVPSTHRVQDQSQSPLTAEIRPLFQGTLTKICQDIDRILPLKDGQVFSFRPRILIHGDQGQGLMTYLAPAVLHYLEKLPCHRLDIPALFSNSARSPEEALFHIFHEAKRTIPSIIYMPHINRLWKIMTDSVRETFVSLLSDIKPSAPLLILAVMEDEEGMTSIPENIFSTIHKEIFYVDYPNNKERRQYFAPIFQAANEPVPDVHVEEQLEETEELAVLPANDIRELTEKEEKRLRKKEERLRRELRIFLRDIWAKINKEQKFFMFRVPVDTEEVYDYLDTVREPMDFDTMLTKLDEGKYKCAQNFLDDIDLISENAIAYNSDLNYETNKVICHRARALQDFCYALVKAEMDTDFEDECQEIMKRREELTKKLDETPKENGHDETNGSEVNGNSSKKKKARKRVSSWARGESKSRRRVRKDNSVSNDNSVNGVDENGEENEEEEDQEEEVEDQEMEELPPSEQHKNGKLTSPKNDKTKRQISSSPEDILVPTGVRIDQSKLNQIQNDLVLNTEGFTIEKLERVYSQLMECVSQYKSKWDRTKLPGDMQIIVASIKSAPSSSTPRNSRRVH